jgi:hypothetical protein
MTQFTAIIALAYLSVAQSQYQFGLPSFGFAPQNWNQGGGWNQGGNFAFPNFNNNFNQNQRPPPPPPPRPNNQRPPINQRPVNRPLPPLAQPNRPATPAPTAPPPRSGRISETSLKRLTICYLIVCNLYIIFHPQSASNTRS